MNKLLLGLLSATLLLWLGLGLMRAQGSAEMDAIQQAYVEHYRDGGRDAVVEWDFEANKLVEVPDSSVIEMEGSGGLMATGVRTSQDDPSLDAYALVLAEFPNYWFHGLFVLVAVSLAALYVRARK